MGSRGRFLGVCVLVGIAGVLLLWPLTHVRPGATPSTTAVEEVPTAVSPPQAHEEKYSQSVPQPENEFAAPVMRTSPPVVQPEYAVNPKIILDPSAAANPKHWDIVRENVLPDFCLRQPIEHERLGCEDRDAIQLDQMLGAGKSKTVYLASLRTDVKGLSAGTRFAFKSALLKSDEPRAKQNDFEARRDVLQLELNKTLLMDSTTGFMRVHGFCVGKNDAWTLSELGESGAFGRKIVSKAPVEGLARMARSVCRLFGCLSRHRFGFGFISDNKPEQFLVRKDWGVELADLDGLRFYTPGSRGRMGELLCKSNLHCVANKRRPTMVTSPDNVCDTNVGKCHGEDNVSMVYVLGNMFLTPIAERLPALQNITTKCVSRDRSTRPSFDDVITEVDRATKEWA